MPYECAHCSCFNQSFTFTVGAPVAGPNFHFCFAIFCVFSMYIPHVQYTSDWHKTWHNTSSDTWLHACERGGGRVIKLGEKEEVENGHPQMLRPHSAIPILSRTSSIHTRIGALESCNPAAQTYIAIFIQIPNIRRVMVWRLLCSTKKCTLKPNPTPVCSSKT